MRASAPAPSQPPDTPVVEGQTDSAAELQETTETDCIITSNGGAIGREEFVLMEAVSSQLAEAQAQGRLLAMVSVAVGEAEDEEDNQAAGGEAAFEKRLVTLSGYAVFLSLGWHIACSACFCANLACSLSAAETHSPSVGSKATISCWSTSLSCRRM